MSFLWEILVALSIVYFILINATYTVLTVFSFAQAGFWTRQARHTNFDALKKSHLSPPVSIVIPAHNEEALIVDTVATALSIDYPEFEVIVVNDGSTDRMLRHLIETFNLKGSQRPYRGELPTERVRRIYYSEDFPNLRVVDKENGGKADALNAGVNLSGYRYVCNTDADTLFEKDALLRIMRSVVRDPRRNVAVGGQVRVGNGFVVREGEIVERRLPASMLAKFQIVEYLRTFLGNRLGWSAINALLLISGAFGLWRRDVIVSVGGFNRDITGEDLEITLRLHRVLRKRGEDFRVLSLPDPVCWTEVPEKISSFYQQRNRWHRVLLESFNVHREMLLNPFFGAAGMVGMTYYLFFEIIGPFMEAASYVFVFGAFMLGIIEVETLGLFLLLSIGYTTLLNTSAVLIEELHFGTYSVKEVFTLLVLGFFDNLGYRQFTMVVRVIAFFDWVSHTRGWGQITRHGFSIGEPEEA